MLGANNAIENSYREFEKETKKHRDYKLMKAYNNAFDSYLSACERYERLVKTHEILVGNKVKTQAGIGPEIPGKVLPLTIKQLRRMIEEAYREKSIIAEHARECVRHLNALKFKM